MLSNEPQGGFITREPSTEALVASDNFRYDNGRYENETASGSFFSAIGAPRLAMPVGRAAGAIVECNRAGSKTRQTARRPHGCSGPFAPDPTWCRGHPMSVLLHTRRSRMRDSVAHKVRRYCYGRFVRALQRQNRNLAACFIRSHRPPGAKRIRVPTGRDLWPF